MRKRTNVAGTARPHGQAAGEVPDRDRAELLPTTRVVRTEAPVLDAFLLTVGSTGPLSVGLACRPREARPCP